MRATELSGLPVVSSSAGEDIAEVRDVVYDSEAHQLIGFTLNKRGVFAGRMKDVLPAEAVTAIGADAVMVLDERSITESASPEALENPGAAKSVIGARVLSADGKELGEVIGVVVSTGARPAAIGYEIEPTENNENVFVPISEQIALSEDNLLLPAGATEFSTKDLAGFEIALVAYRELHEGGETNG